MSLFGCLPPLHSPNHFLCCSTSTLSFVLFVGFILLPAASPSMVIQTALGTPHSLFPDPFTSVKSSTNIGPDSPYKIPFSSFDHDAPLLFLDPSDVRACPGCCEAFSSSSSALSPLSLSASSSFSVVNRTVLLTMAALEACSPTINFLTGHECMHVALERKGARAVVIVDDSIEPGL